MEIIEREMAGTLLLAAEAASRGWQCIVGTRHSITPVINELPNGIVFVKSLLKSDENNLNIYKDAGNKIASQDIEGMIYATIQEFVDIRFHPNTVALADKILFWGKTQLDAVRQAYPDHAHKFVETGSPTADIWRRKELHSIYQDEVKALQDKYGPYIILPSSFGTVNHFMGKKSTLNMILQDKLIQDDKRNEFEVYWNEYEDFLEKIFHDLLNLLPYISRSLPEHTIIVRPHPSEGHKAWIEAAAGCDNIKVIFDGPVTPWLLGADAVIHWGCTTGVEAYLLGRPVLTYDAISTAEDIDFIHDLPDAVSIIKSDRNDFLETLQQIINKPDQHTAFLKGRDEVNEKLSKWLKMGDQDYAEVKILDELEKISFSGGVLETLPEVRANLKEKIWRFIEKISDTFPFLNQFFPSRIKDGLSARSYGRHKIRPMELDKLSSILDKICKAKMIEGLEINKIRDNLFVINNGHDK